MNADVKESLIQVGRVKPEMSRQFGCIDIEAISECSVDVRERHLLLGQ